VLVICLDIVWSKIDLDYSEHDNFAVLIQHHQKSLAGARLWEGFAGHY